MPNYVDDKIAVTLIIDLRDGTTKAQTVLIGVDTTDEDRSKLLLGTFNDLVVRWKMSKRVPSESIPKDDFEQEYEV